MKQTSVWYHLASTNKLIKRYFIKYLPPNLKGNVSPIQLGIIDYLQDNSDKVIYQKDICDEFNIRRSTASGVLKNMEKNNIISSASIGRCKIIRLSDTFMNKNECPNMTKLEHLIEKEFTEVEKEELIRLLKKIENSLKEEENV